MDYLWWKFFHESGHQTDNLWLLGDFGRNHKDAFDAISKAESLKAAILFTTGTILLLIITILTKFC